MKNVVASGKRLVSKTARLNTASNIRFDDKYIIYTMVFRLARGRDDRLRFLADFQRAMIKGGQLSNYLGQISSSF